VRFRAALARRGVGPGDRVGVVAAVAETVDTAGKAVAFSAVTVLGSLAAILIVPSPAFRSMALGIMLSVIAVLAATLTLLPAVLGRLGTRINAGRIRIRRRPRTRTRQSLDERLHAWGRLLWRHPLPAGLAALGVLLVAAAPVLGLHTNMPSITIVPPTANARIGYDQITRAFRARRPRYPAGPRPSRSPASRSRHPGADGRGRYHHPRFDPRRVDSGPGRADHRAFHLATGATIDRIRQVLPTGSLVGGRRRRITISSRP